MVAVLNRPAFYDAVRSNPFPKYLTPSQVSGMDAILDACPPDFATDWLSYCLATALHETAHTMQPIAEIGKGKGRPYGNPVAPYGQVYYGRGLVQLTWPANYKRATSELRARGYLLPVEDLERTPDLAMRSDIAAAILFFGSSLGWFTGKKLSDYFSASKSDPVGARHIINGSDKADLIAGYFSAFQKALRAAGHVPGGVTTKIPVPPVSAQPVAPVSVPSVRPVVPPAPSAWASFKSWLTGRPA